MAGPQDIYVNVRLRDLYSTELRRAEGQFRVFSFGLRDLGRALTSVQGLLLTGLGVAGFKQLLGSMVSEAMEAERVTHALAVALETAGVVAVEDQARFQALAETLAQTTKYTDEQVRSTEALLLTMGVAPDRLERTTRAVLDLASAFNLDLETAARAVGKSVQGNTDALSRFGMVISREAIPPGREFESVMAAIEARVGGRAGRELQTFAGSAAQLGKALGELMESFGKIATEGGGGLNMLKTFSEALDGLKRFVDENRDILREAVIGIAQAIVQLGKVLAQVIGGLAIPLLERLGNVQRPIVLQFKAWADAQEGVTDAARDAAVALLEQSRNVGEYRAKMQSAIDVVVKWPASLTGTERSMLDLLSGFERSRDGALDFRSGMEGAYLALGQMSSGADALILRLQGLAEASRTARQAEAEAAALRARTRDEFAADIPAPERPAGEAEYMAARGEEIAAGWAGLMVGLSEFAAAAGETVVGVVETVQAGAQTTVEYLQGLTETVDFQRAYETAAREERFAAEDDERAYVEENLQAILAGRVAATNQEYQSAVQLEQRKRQLRRQALQDTATMFGALAALSESQGRAAFQTTKTFMYAEAVVSGIAAVQKAWESAPWPYNLPAIIATVAATAANLSTIASTEPGGGAPSSSAAISAGGGLAPAGGGAGGGGAGLGLGFEAQAAPRAQEVNITVNGLAVVKDELALARLLADALREAGVQGAVS